MWIHFNKCLCIQLTASILKFIFAAEIDKFMDIHKNVVWKLNAYNIWQNLIKLSKQKYYFELK